MSSQTKNRARKFDFLKEFFLSRMAILPLEALIRRHLMHLMQSFCRVERARARRNTIIIRFTAFELTCTWKRQLLPVGFHSGYSDVTQPSSTGADSSGVTDAARNLMKLG